MRPTDNMLLIEQFLDGPLEGAYVTNTIRHGFRRIHLVLRGANRINRFHTARLRSIWAHAQARAHRRLQCGTSPESFDSFDSETRDANQDTMHEIGQSIIDRGRDRADKSSKARRYVCIENERRDANKRIQTKWRTTRV